ncbi:siderophore-interacting protein [Brevundimonas sp. GCM10030266]|uniref:siderophore-interacting protein n=1 Tax=Brevundimonas sp. GCM10030266 TaxID=3273386 RepID=UPI003605ACC9
MTDTLRIPRRVRHSLKFRLLEVVEVSDLTPSLKRVVLTGDLEDFVSLGFDDHVKIFPPREGEPLVLPTVGPDGPVFPEPRPTARDYTPRVWDTAAKTLTIDFAVGHGGPATDWVMAARPGSQLGVGGPRGSFIVPTAFAHHVLIGDETAVPAISRRLEELPAGVKATVIVEVEDEASAPPLTSAAELTVVRVDRNGGPRGRVDGLQAAVEAALADIPREDAYVWIAGESQVARTLRGVVVAMGFDPKAMKAAGYWRAGAVGAHEVIED